MKQIIIFVTAAFFTVNSFASVPVELPNLNAKEIFIPVGNSGKKISLMELSIISQNDLQALTGRKMNFVEKISFTISQRKLRKSIKADGTIDDKKLEKFFQKGDGESSFHLGGFLMGFFLNIIGVLIAYLINDDYKQDRVKWAWIGCSLVLGILGILRAVAG